MTRGLGPAAGQRRLVPSRPGASSVRVLGPPGGRSLPLQVEPAGAGIGLAEWAAENAGTVRSWLLRSGAVLFRGFGVTLAGFPGVGQALAGELADYTERSSPRTRLGDHVYTATDYPADQPIPLHNENSYQASFPAMLLFCCLAPAERGGATPLADTRRVLARIGPDVLAPFAEHGVLYLRNLGGGLGLPWQEVFQTASRETVNEYCRSRGITARWRPGGGLRLRQVRPAIAVHPVTGERVWFNHGIFFNARSLLPEVRIPLLEQVAEEDLPSHTYYGDGSPIPAGALAELAEAYRAEESAVPWQAGDVLLVDNLLAAHGRQPYSGNRQVVVSMAAPIDWSAVDARGKGRA
jgi:alpha-ketoglutarate-dependent taurine dioxygenase